MHCIGNVARLTATKYHSLGDLNSRSLFPYSPEGWEFKIRVWAGLVSSEGLS